MAPKSMIAALAADVPDSKLALLMKNSPTVDMKTSG